jgi:hypothetical protein
LDRTTCKFSGRTDKRYYSISGTLRGDTVMITYTATRLDAPGSYTGQETLTRVSR